MPKSSTVVETTSKPLLRGVSHAVASVATIFAGIRLTQQTNTARGYWSAVVFCSCLFTQYAASAAYHVINWDPKTRSILRRLDHAAIFLLIAGTLAPMTVFCFSQEKATQILTLIGTLLVLGLVQSLFFVNLPKSLAALIYVGYGAIGFYDFEEASCGAGGAMSLLKLGAFIYVFGALIYVIKRPNPSPKYFGYHEIFHVCVILAAASHYEAIKLLIK